MANVCGDDVYFFSSTNPEGLLSLWEDLEASVIICTDADKAWIGNLFEYKEICTTGIGLRGTVSYMERDEGHILLSTDAAWTPLLEAYAAIADTYGVEFMMLSIEPGEGIYYNTDTSGKYFPDRYMVSIRNEELVTPSGERITEKLEYDNPFALAEDILACFQALGYEAESFEALKDLLEESDIYIHEFENPYQPDDAAA